MAFESYIPAYADEITEDGQKKLERLFYMCNTLLGGNSIPVQLEREDYMVGFEKALNIYRSRSARSVNQTYAFLRPVPGQSHYVLNERVDVVKKITRTGGPWAGIGSYGEFEPFGASTANIILRGGLGADGSMLDIATYEFMTQYDETLSRIFAREIGFRYFVESHTLEIYQMPTHDEMYLLHISLLKTCDELLTDHWAFDWLQKYTHAVVMGILGEKYSLFANAPGPQGGTIMKGPELKTESARLMKEYEDDLLVGVTGDSGDVFFGIRG